MTDGWRIAMRATAIGYLTVLLFVPVGFVLYRTFEPGLDAVWASLTTPAAIHAFWLTVEVTAIAVAANTVFGIVMALAIARGRFPGKALLDALIDLPFAVSPVVVGIALILVYGADGWLGSPLADAGIRIIFSVPGIVLATIFVSLPFVVRETVPVLREAGTESEEAAATLGAGRWQTLARITLPAIRWGVAYGVVLSIARALGEYGAVSVVSGNITGKTQTMTLLVERRFANFDLHGAYVAAALLAVLAVASLLAMSFVNRSRRSQ